MMSILHQDVAESLGNLNPGWLMLSVFGVIRLLYQRSIEIIFMSVSTTSTLTPYQMQVGGRPESTDEERKDEQAYTACYRQFGRNGTPFPPFTK